MTPEQMAALVEEARRDERAALLALIDRKRGTFPMPDFVTAAFAARGEGGSDDATFLAYMLAAAEAGDRVSAESVARLRRLADWAEGAPPPHWTGTIDRYETQRAVKAARKRMEAGNE